MADYRLIGKDFTPPDLVAKVTGKARYAEDFRAEGMLFAKLLLSPMPHCRVNRIDAARALAIPGVEAILTYDDIPKPQDPLAETILTNEPLYEGAPIVAVAATSEELAAEAIEKIKLDLEPLPFVLDPLDSLRPGGPNARIGGNIIKGRKELKELKWTSKDFADAGDDQLPLGEPEEEWTVGDLEAAFAQSELILEETFVHQSLTHHPMEPRSCMAYWQNGKLFIYPSTQSVMRTVPAAAAQAGIDPSQVVLINEFTGGGFGSKIAGTINMGIPALLAKKTGKPVMHRVTRSEESYIGRARPGFQARIKMGFRKDGKVTGIDMFVVQDNGPFGRQGDIGSAGRATSLSYTPLAMRFREVSVLTNTPPRAPQRAPGGVQIQSMTEPMLDRAAKRLSIDKLAMRRINAPDASTLYGSDQHKVTSAFVREAVDKAAQLFNWEEFKKASGQRNGSKVTGVSAIMGTYVAGSSGFDGLMLVKPDGKLYVHQGIGNLGTHSIADTALPAAEILGLDWSQVEIVWGNTGKHVPYSSVQAGSQTTHAHTRANHAAAMDLKRKLQEIAAKDLGGSPESYEVGGGRVFQKANRSRGLTFAKAAERAVALGGKYDGHELPEKINDFTKVSASALAGSGLLGVAKDEYPHEGDSWSFCVAFCKVEVDVETGELEIKDFKVVADVGTVLNPRSLGAQLHGGAVQGFGTAIAQKWLYDPQWGVPFSNRLYTARPPTILEVPLEMDFAAVEIPDPQTPVGAKGIGEAPIVAGAAAVLCALQDAVGEVPLNRTPVMTDMILNTLESQPQPYRGLKVHV
jgi:xanthine dehydrogenase molybdenum-binding subunit